MKVAVVTGAGRGLGAAVARRLHADGLGVALCDVDGVAVERLAAELSSGVVAVEMDVRSQHGWRQALTAAISLGEVVALVNNAALSQPGGVLDLDAAAWDDVLATNLRGPFLGIREVAPYLQQRGRGGRIVNVSSDAAFTGRGVMGAHYAASKAGLLGLTRRAAAELAGSGITVNAVAPGALDGETLRELAGVDTGSVAADIPLGRLGDVDEVAALVAWLVSDEAGYVTGATLRVDGGAGL